MIKKLQAKLVLLSMAALLMILTLVITGINIVNYRGVVQDADKILDILSENQGSFPEMKGEQRPGGQKRSMVFGMSTEVPYESRYFSVVIDGGTGDVIQAETSRIVSIDSEKAAEYAGAVLDGGKERGFADAFRFRLCEEEEKINVIFLDCGRKLDAFRKFLFASVGISLIGYAAVLVLVVIFSNRIIRPIAESYEKQKRFITDAVHEIKTPLTIIHADD